MTRTDEAEIRARLEAAGNDDPFPWTTLPQKGDIYVDIVDGRGDNVGSVVLENAAEFIAHAPTDIAALLGEVERLRADAEAGNAWLRKELWLRHGCPFPALYGDDGEQQCNQCMIDFKRDSIAVIRGALERRGAEVMAELNANPDALLAVIREKLTEPPFVATEATNATE